MSRKLLNREIEVYVNDKLIGTANGKDNNMNVAYDIATEYIQSISDENGKYVIDYKIVYKTEKVTVTTRKFIEKEKKTKKKLDNNEQDVKFDTCGKGE
jgi:hypothetical protein